MITYIIEILDHLFMNYVNDIKSENILRIIHKFKEDTISSISNQKSHIESVVNINNISLRY